jgi:CheY-like chemotaxis protein
METKVDFKKRKDPLHILLIGNNPIDMGSILEKIHQIHSTKVITEIAFDLKSIIERLMKFKPNYILIDDNIGKMQLSETVQTLAHKRKTKDIPITVLKNSNYEEAYGSGTPILDYLLKTNVSAESLYNTVRNSLRFKRTQAYLHKAFNRKRGLLKRLQA